MKLEVLHADNHVLAVAKPSGVPVAPDDSGDESLLDQAREWLARERHKPGRAFVGLVHRLDRPVSGLVVFACTSKGASRLAAAFREGRAKKLYFGLGCRALSPRLGNSGDWRGYLRKDHERNTVETCAAHAAGAKAAHTRWWARRAGENEAVTCFAFEPHTGRAHQLRVTAAELGAPLLGDLRYGAREALDDASIALHAAELEVPHPVLDQPLRLSAALPARAWWSGFSDPRPPER